MIHDHVRKIKLILNIHFLFIFYRELSNFPSKFSWCQPQPEMFVSFCVKKMDWLQEYCVEKITDTVVKWQVSTMVTIKICVSSSVEAFRVCNQ